MEKEHYTFESKKTYSTSETFAVFKIIKRADDFGTKSGVKVEVPAPSERLGILKKVYERTPAGIFNFFI